MPDAIDDARRLIESRLAELATEAAELRRALEGLRDGGASSSRRGGRRTPPKPAPANPRGRASRRRKTPRRAPRGRRREELLAAVTVTPGARPADLAKQIGIKPAQVHALISKARAEKLIVKRGGGYALKS